MFTKPKLLGWVRVIVWNAFQKSMDIRVKLSDWDRPLGVWTIWAPRNDDLEQFSKAKLVGWVKVIVWATFQKSTDIRLKLSEWDRYLWVWTILIPRKQIYSNVY